MSHASGPIRHVTELISLIRAGVQTNPVLFLYTDGGLDQQLTFIAVQLSLISYFLHLHLDCLYVTKTTSYHSWRNPVEHIMSVTNFGIKCVGLAQYEADGI